MRKATYRPRLMVLEDRAVPGTVLSKLDPTVLPVLGTSLDLTGSDLPGLVGMSRSDLDLTAAEAIAVTAFEGQQTPAAFGQPATGSGLGEVMTPIQNQQLVDLSSQVLPINFDGDHGGNPPPGPSDMVNMGFLDQSKISTHNNQFSVMFGADPATDGWDNVLIDSGGNMSAAQSDFHIGYAEVVNTGFHFRFQLLAEADLSGTYDRGTGAATLTTMMDVQVTSPDAPMFDNNNCFIGLYPDMMNEQPVPTNFSTDPKAGGTAFSTDDQGRENGVLVDNTFAVDAIPMGKCNSGPFLIDWAQAINSTIGLPADSGTNNFTWHASFDHSIGP